MMRRLLLLLLVAVCLPLLSSAQDAKTRFAWGAEFGSSIDVGGYDMSTIDFNASFGMSRSWIKFLGVGAQASIMASSSCRSYPLYLVFRTDFSRDLKLLFLDIRGGASLNYLARNVQQTAPYGSINLGINLATGKKFRSYILVGYTYLHRKDAIEDEFTTTPYDPIHYANLRLGVSF